MTPRVDPRWVRYSSIPGGMGSGDLGGELGVGPAPDAEYVWARFNISRTVTDLEVRCKACARIRLSNVLGGIGVFTSYLSEDLSKLYVVASDITDVGCYAVHFRGAQTYVVQVKREPGVPPPVVFGTPVEYSETPPQGARADVLLSVIVPAAVQTPGTYTAVLVDRCSSTEHLLGTMYLEDEIMMIPLSSAQLDIPPALLSRPATTSEMAYGFLGGGPAIDTIPFDKCTGVLEYDARLGSLPSGQGWSELAPGSGQFSLFEGVLQQNRVGGPQDYWYKTLELDVPAESVYAYALMRTLGNMQAILVGAKGVAAAAADGVRLQLETSSHGQQLLNYALNGSVPVGSSVSGPRGWLRVGGALEATGNTRGALEASTTYSAGDQATFTASIVPTTADRIEAHFGALDDVLGYAWYRYVCVSANGKFHRPYFRGVSQVPSPVLRLYLFAESVVGDDTARFLVRYGTGLTDPRGRPVATVAATAAITAAGTVYELALTLTDVGVGPVWFSIERDWSHADDLLDGTVHLSQITLRAV